MNKELEGINKRLINLDIDTIKENCNNIKIVKKILDDNEFLIEEMIRLKDVDSTVAYAIAKTALFKINPGKYPL